MIGTPVSSTRVAPSRSLRSGASAEDRLIRPSRPVRVATSEPTAVITLDPDLFGSGHDVPPRTKIMNEPRLGRSY